MNPKVWLTIVCLFGIASSVHCFDSFLRSETFLFEDENDGFPDIADAKTFVAAKDSARRTIAEYMKKQSVPGMVFGMSVRNVPFFKTAEGMFDLENEIPADINGLFRMASVTKTLTSMFIGTLVEAGKLKYEDSIFKHLPGGSLPVKFFNHTNVEITVGELLSHMSGLHETNDTDIYNLRFPKNSIEAIAQLRFEPLYFKPGTDFKYSNYGFQVLGAIIEQITGKSYIDVISEFYHKMMLPSSESCIETGATMLHHHSRPKYYKRDNDTKAAIPVGMFDDALQSIGMWAAGGLISNVDDLLRYGNVVLDIYHGRPNAMKMKKETLATIWTGRTMNAPGFPGIFRPSSEYGYGWIITNIPKSVNPELKPCNPSYRYHTGGLLGVSTFLAVYPEEEIVVVAMANLGLVLDLEAFCTQVVESFSDFFPKH